MASSNAFYHVADGLLGDIGTGMMQTGKTNEFSRDVEAMYCIARSLLDLPDSSDKKSLSWTTAEDFITMPSDIDIRFILKVRLFDNKWWLYRANDLYSTLSSESARITGVCHTSGKYFHFTSRRTRTLEPQRHSRETEQR